MARNASQLYAARDRHATVGEHSAPARGSTLLRVLLVGLDAAALTLAWTISIILAPAHGRSILASIVATAALVACGLGVFSRFGLYRSRVCVVRTVEYERVARACFVVALLALAVSSVADAILAPREIALGAFLTLLIAITARSGYRSWLTHRRRVGRNLRSVLLVGAGDECVEIAALLRDHPELGYRAVGVVGDEADVRRNDLYDDWRADLSNGVAAIRELGVTGAIVCASDLSSSQLNQAVQGLLNAGTHVHLSSGLHGIDVGRLRPSPLAHEPLFYVERVTLASWQLTTKRAIDLVLAAVMVTLTSPILAVAAIAIKLQDRGPVLFRQQRIGRDGAPFVLYKLRTMREGAQHETAHLQMLNGRDGPLAKFYNDPRVTTFGRILRSTSIDELPQLWNVLNGTMSLVGPRPALPDEVVQFDAALRAREAVRPGITGLWQVEGRDNPSFAAYRRFDLFYLQNWSVALDIMILLGTVESVVVRVFRGLLHPGEEIHLAPPEVLDPSREARRRSELTEHGDRGRYDHVDTR